MCELTISAHANGNAFFQSAVLAPISVDPKDGALLVFRTGSVLDLLLDGPPEEALGITAAVRVALAVRAVVTGAARVAGLAARLQHAHQHRVPLAQLSARATRHVTHHSLALPATTPPLSSNSDAIERRERAIRLSRTAPTRMAVDSGLCGRCVARRTVTRATYLPAADPPEKVRVPPAPSRAPNGPRRSRMRRRRCTGAPDIGRAHPGGVAARGRSPRVVDRSIAQPRRLPRAPPAPGTGLQPARVVDRLYAQWRQACVTAYLNARALPYRLHWSNLINGSLHHSALVQFIVRVSVPI